MSDETYKDRLVADAARRFEKVVRPQPVLDDVPVTELSDGELAWQLSRAVGA